MSFALIATLLSSLCNALMIVTDRFMVNDYYQGKPTNAWIVSSVLGPALGIFLTVLVYVVLIYTGNINSIEALLSAFLTLVWWKAVAMVLGGALVSAMLYEYLVCYSEDANSTAMILWQSATPVFIMLTYFILGFFIPELSTLENLGLTWVAGICMATSGIMLFEYISGNSEDNVKVALSRRYYKHIATYIFLASIYGILLHFIFTKTTTESPTEVFTLLPFYWIGWLSAVAIHLIISRKSFYGFKYAWHSRIHTFIIPIMIVEIIGMLIFFFEYFGLTELNPAYIGVIIGGATFVVYALDILLAKYRLYLLSTGREYSVVLGFTFTASMLPKYNFNTKHTWLELMALVVSVSGIYIASV